MQSQSNQLLTMKVSITASVCSKNDNVHTVPKLALSLYSLSGRLALVRTQAHPDTFSLNYERDKA